MSASALSAISPKRRQIFTNRQDAIHQTLNSSSTILRERQNLVQHVHKNKRPWTVTELNHTSFLF